jgi:predicted N-acetyltransferase YhbS/RimJ/RimL family protein N-acetyltransferase
MIKGKIIELIPAALSDRRNVYDWCFRCETSASHCGLPHFPDVAVPTFEEFLEDYTEYFFTGAALEKGRGFMIVHEGAQVGFISYTCFHLKPNKAELDIWLNSEAHCGKGFGTDAIVSLCAFLCKSLGICEFIMRPSVKNTRAIKSYKKAGFEESCGVPADYLLDEYVSLYGSGDYGEGGDILLVKRNIIIRLETPADHYAVEEMTRDAFWQFWDEGFVICNEHLLVPKLRSCSGFVPELNFVAEIDNRIAGHIIFSRSRVENHEMLTFGPLTVSPEFQCKGTGKALMRHAFHEAKLLGFRAVIIYGNPDYYPRFSGFRRAAEFGITTPDGSVFDALLVYPLYDGALDGISGKYYIDEVYEDLTQEEALEFDKKFPPKKPHVLTPIDVLLERLDSAAAEAIRAQKYHAFDIIKSLSEREIASLPGMSAEAVEVVRALMKERGFRWGAKQ